MKVINAEFERFWDVVLGRLFGAIGVYVIWAGQSIVKPAYIGEGALLKRLAKHDEKFPTLDGVLAILENGSQKEIKRDAEIVEAILLYIARTVDRLPTRNKAAGKLIRISDIFKKHGVLRINISGYDPLLNPSSPRMKEKKVINLAINSYGKVELRHQWKLRPLQPPAW